MRSAIKYTMLGAGVPTWANGVHLWKEYTVPRGPLADPADTHASTINALNAAGVYLPFAANVLTRTDLGLQTVPTRTNLALYSQQFDNAAWADAGASTTANAATAPDGTATADKQVENGGNQTHTRYQTSGTLLTAAAYAVSYYAKAAERTKVRVKTAAAADAAGAYADFDLVAGTVGAVTNLGTTSGATAAITSIGNGWYLCEIRLTATAATYYQESFLLDGTGTASYQGDSTSGLYLWQAQTELGAFATPPILTTSASATVNGNQQVIDLTGRLGTGVAGIVQIDLKETTPANGFRFFEIDDGTDANRVTLAYRSPSTSIQLFVQAASVGQADIATVDTYSSGIKTIVFAASTNYFNARVVGAADPGADTSGTFPSLNRAALGGRGFDTAQNMFCVTKKLAFSFGPQDATTFAAMFARAQIAAVS